jgi:hypothetical protein
MYLNAFLSAASWPTLKIYYLCVPNHVRTTDVPIVLCKEWLPTLDIKNQSVVRKNCSRTGTEHSFIFPRFNFVFSKIFDFNPMNMNHFFTNSAAGIKFKKSSIFIKQNYLFKSVRCVQLKINPF